MPLSRIRFIGAVALILLLPILNGCAQVGFKPGADQPADKSIVFGRILLIRDGEPKTLSTFSTSIRIDKITATREPPLLTESFTKDGRFYWALAPGRYRLTIPLYFTEEFAFTFTVPKSRGAYYFGDLKFVGKKEFHTLNGPNIDDAVPVVEDHFTSARKTLIERNPQLASAPFGHLKVVDITEEKPRLAVFRKLLDEAQTCCTSFTGLRFNPLQIGESHTFGIDATKGVYPFTSGRSFYAAFELPRTNEPYTISIRSEPMPSGFPYAFRLFVPAAILLDKHHKIISRIDKGLTRPVGPSLLPPRPPSLLGEISITPSADPARYLVIHTTDALLSFSAMGLVPGMTPIPGGALPIGSPQILTMDAWPTGRITVSVQPKRH